jgi:KUP system potassium uptake protein
MRVIHTSNRYPGQVYVLAINVLLGIGCVALVVIFKTSVALASAYGLADDGGDEPALLRGAPQRAEVVFDAGDAAVRRPPLRRRRLHRRGRGEDPDRGCIPLAIAVALTVLATTWYSGRRRVMASLAADTIPVETFLAQIGPKATGSMDGPPSSSPATRRTSP